MNKFFEDIKNGFKNMPYIRFFIRNYLRLQKDPEEEALTVEMIRNGVEFKGATLWILIFAIFIASLGLNLNSVAVIIGAMLISPLMGPIMGMGLAVGISDFELLKKSSRSYLVATIFSVITSTIYFALTPLDEAQSELLARTSPTIYDVLIALFGGSAGIIAYSTKEKGNVIPGVAIATALMPPLCTAGFGLATGNMSYFFGAFYLYFINSVFISLATYLGVRIMQFSKKTFVSPERAKLVKRYMIILTVVTMTPALYMTLGIVKSTFYVSAANKFVNNEFNLPQTQVIDKKISYSDREIKVVLMGKEINKSQVAIIKDQMKEYNLSGTKLFIYQGENSGALDVGSIKSQIMQEFYKNSEVRITEQQHVIDSLNKELQIFAAYHDVDKNIIPEIKVLYPEAESIAMAKTVELSVDSTKEDTITLALMTFKTIPDSTVQNKITSWLKARLGAKKLKLVIR